MKIYENLFLSQLGLIHDQIGSSETQEEIFKSETRGKSKILHNKGTGERGTEDERQRETFYLTFQLEGERDCHSLGRLGQGLQRRLHTRKYAYITDCK